MKRLFKLFTLCMALLIGLLTLTGCFDLYGRKLREIDKIPLDVDYRPIFITTRGISKDNDEVFYLNNVKKLVAYNEDKAGFITQMFQSVDSLYYSVCYDNYVSPTDENSYAHEHDKCYKKIGFFRTDMRTGECELLYDYGKVLPRFEYDHIDYEYNVMSRLSDTKAAFTYNGKLEIFDLNTNQVTWSEQIFDPLTVIDFHVGFSNDESKSDYPFKLIGNDYVANFGKRLEYYKFNGETFDKHVFEDDRIAKYTEVVGTVLWTYDLADMDSERLCFDINTFEKYYYTYHEFEEAYFENKKAQKEEASQFLPTVTVGGVEYSLESGDDTVIITDPDGEVVKIIDESSFLESEKYSALLEPFGSVRGMKIGFHNSEGRLFVLTSSYFSWAAETPRFIFEYDFESDTLKYAGYISSLSFIVQVYYQ